MTWHCDPILSGWFTWVVNLTVPWEDMVDETHERRKQRYSQLNCWNRPARLEWQGMFCGIGMPWICSNIHYHFTQRVRDS